MHSTYCRNCTHSCGLQLSVEDNRIVEIRPVKDHILSQGYVCAKAQMSVDFTNGGEGRLLESLERQADGSFAPIDAELALNRIAERLQRIIAEHGPRAVALYVGTGGCFSSLAYPMAKALLGEIGSPNFASSMTIDQSAIWVAMSRMGFMASGKPLPTEVDTLLLAGTNPILSHAFPGTYRPRVAFGAFRKRGGKLIVIDPRQTETAKMADLHLAIRPGEDATLFAGMIRIMLEHRWHDQDFCDAYVDCVEALAAAVAPYVPAYVEQRTGIAPDELMLATRWFSEGPKSLAMGATGVTMGPASNLSYHLLECLNVLRACHRREGETVTNQRVLFNKPDVEKVIPAFRGWEHGTRCHSVDAGYIFGELPTGALPDEILTPGEHQIRAVICWAGNPAKALGQPAKTIEAFKSLDLLVSIDPRMTDTAELSDYVIAPTLPYERYDLTVINEKVGMNTSFIQCATPILDPPAGTMADTDFFWELARRLDLRLTYKKLALGMTYPATKGGHVMDMTRRPDQRQLLQWWCEGTSVDLDTLLAHPDGLAVDMPQAIVMGALRKEDSPRLQLLPDDVAEDLAKLSQKRDADAYRYRLITRRLLETMNSAYQESTFTKRAHSANFAYMNPADMEADGLAAGAAVRIASAHGSLDGVVKADKGLRRGVVAMSHLWGAISEKDGLRSRPGAFTGRLVSLDEGVEGINRMPQQTAIPINVALIS